MSSFAVKVSSILGVSVVVFMLDLFYLTYMTTKGLEAKLQTIVLSGLSVSLPLQWLPVFGVVLLSLVMWYETYYRVFPRRGLEIDPLARMRLARVVVLSLTFFVLVLYLPALIGSSWFWISLSDTGRGVAQVQDFGNSLLYNFQSLMGLAVIWQYSVSQTLASAVMVIGAWALGRTTRRPRK